MRILFSILLFASFAIRPAMEISTVLYYQFNIDTIVEKYCVNKERPRLQCNGKCYLMNQMKTSKQSSPENGERIVISESFIPLFFQSSTLQIIHTDLVVIENSNNWTIKHMYSSAISKDIDHPPQDQLV